MSYLPPVPRSAELDRVLALPRRVWTPEQGAALAEQWSPALLNERGRAVWDALARLPAVEREAELTRIAMPRDRGGENCPLRLKPIQAIGLYELHHLRGLFAAAAVGAGKTLLSLLAPLVVGAERPLLIVPASVERKTHDDFADLAQYWTTPRPMPVVETYSRLGRLEHADLLCDCQACSNEAREVISGLRPDLVIADECQMLRNSDAACRRRLGRYMARHPETIYVALSGSPMRKSIRDLHHHLVWALKYQAPVPLNWKNTEEWSQAIDFKPRDDARRQPGALGLAFAGDAGAEVEDVRRGFQKFLRETPGVLISDEQSCDQPLTIRLLCAPPDPVLDAAFQQFRETQATLDGWDLGDPMSVLKHATELGCGFYYRWDPRPPQEWLDARRAAAVFVREAIAESQRGNRRPLESEGQVYRRHPNAPELVAWKEIEPTFKPNSVPVPVTASILGYAAEWLRVNGPALVWVQHSYIGEALSAMTGVPYFSKKGRDAAGRYIGKYPANKSAICSLHSNKVGRNLQGWNRALVVGPPQAAPDWEQGPLGRMHRQGQDRPVFVDVLIGCAENLHAIQMAHAEAHFDADMLKADKLTLAQFDWQHFPVEAIRRMPLNHPSKPRWTRPGGIGGTDLLGGQSITNEA